MQKTLKANFKIFDAKKFRVGIVVAQFNKDISNKLLISALAKLAEYGVSKKSIAVHYVAGSVEIPVILQALAKTKKYNCLVALGTIIRGDTPHFDCVCKIISEGVLRVMLDYSVPVGFGVLTLENKKQAMSRFHIGGGATEAVLQTAKEIIEIEK